MSNSTLQFITQVKLGELRRQRALLLAEYDRLARAAAAQPPLDALKTLRDGLGAVKVAGQPLHPDLDHLDLLFRGPAPSPAIVAFWRSRLDAELAAGRLRADIVYLFGALLGEWGSDDDARQPFLDERRQAHAALLERALAPADATPQAHALFQDLFATFADGLRQAPAAIDRAIAHRLEHPERGPMNLERFADDIYQPAPIRQEACRFRDDLVLQQELVAALHVVARGLADWDWPAEGVPARTLWTRNKWRLYLDLSLVQLCLLDQFSDLWSGSLEDACTDTARKINRLARLHKLLEHKAPEVIVENERRMLREQEERLDLGWYEPVDPWDGQPPILPGRATRGIVVRRAAAWTAFYDDGLAALEPAKPRETKVMKTLVDDFIARGQEISGGKQQGLSDYWRWVLCLYGPEILDRFGTFRFLLTDLVPLQLIHEQLLHDSSLDA